MSGPNERLRIWQRWWFPFAITGAALFLFAITVNVYTVYLEGPVGYIFRIGGVTAFLLLPLACILSIVHAYKVAKQRRVMTALTYIACAACSVVPFVWILSIIYLLFVNIAGY